LLAFDSDFVKIICSMAQMLLIPDPRPLDKRLGKKFFKNAPKRAGVYLMRDANEKVLYVGKAKNLRERIGNYRIANPDKMPRRHLKMVRQVARIEFQLCHNEAAALKRESKLIRTIKPKFNRAGVWPAKTRFIVWRLTQDHLELAITEVPEPTWRRFDGTVGVSRYLHESLSRLLWLALNPARAYAELPAGWSRGVFGQGALIHCGEISGRIESLLELYFWKSSDEFLLWLSLRISARAHSFERAAIEADLEVLKEFAAKQTQKPDVAPQLGLL
jgi:predicted GIY-YIG superfamily endonuclease